MVRGLSTARTVHPRSVRPFAPHTPVMICVVLVFCLGFWSSSSLAAGPAGRGVCQRYASTTGNDHGPGSLGRPFRTPQRLVASLHAGRTGCLFGGVYSGGGRLTFTHGGAPGAPLTLRSVPGQSARLALGGIVRVAPGATDITLRDLDIDGTANADVTVWIQGDRTRLEHDLIGNGNAGMSCVIIGDGVSVTIARNRFHQCGTPAHGNQDHAIYAADTHDSHITENVFWGTTGWAVHLYPDAQRTLVMRNVIDDNGRGIVVGGDDSTASSDNLITQNVISNALDEYLVQSYWAGPVGTGNRVEHNCLYRGALGTIIAPRLGFEATGNVVAAPRYEDAAAHDYRMFPGSRCLSLVGGDIATRARSGT